MTADSIRRHLACWLVLCQLKEFSTEAAVEILRLSGTLEDGISSPPEPLAKMFPRLVKSIRKLNPRKTVEYYEDVVQRMMDEGIRIVTSISENYPRRLFDLPDPPLSFFVKGDLDAILGTKSVAIVGTRSPTRYGRRMSRRIAELLAQHAYTVVSGLAYGVDAAAHEGALEGGGRTVAVLPSYVGRVVPQGNAQLASAIIDNGGALISEYGPDSQVSLGNFVHRNRIIAALAESTIIVEGSMRSGTRHQARYAVDLGRPLFVVRPVDRTKPSAQLPIYLLSQGARQISSEEDAVTLIQGATGQKPEVEQTRLV